MVEVVLYAHKPPGTRHLGRDRPRIVAHLRAMHAATLGGIERAAPVQRAAVVPYHKIARLPRLGPGVIAVRDMGPELIKQSVAFGVLKEGVG
jgi:hypothetical protein